MNIHKTMQKIVATALLLFTTQYISAQVYIQTTLPAAGLVQKNQLWNLVLVNGTNGPVEGRLTLILRNRQQNTELMTATTSRFTLPRGSLSVNINNLNPVQYNYLGMDPNTSLNGLLPAGSYTACYSFARINGERQEILSEECVPFDTEPLSPPMLIFPADSSALQSNPAQFSWTPPAPSGMLSRLHYEIFITEIRTGQKAEQAMQENLPFYHSANVPGNFITYPAALPAFDKEKWYSWQVVARDDKNYAGKTEVWVFKINKQNAMPDISQGTPYLKMKPDNPDQGIAANGILKLSFFNRSGDREAQVLIENLSEPDGQKAYFPVNIKNGENQAEIKLNKKINISETATYKATIVYSSGEKNSVLFRVIKLKTNDGIINQ